jgi:hypothetical protein
LENFTYPKGTLNKLGPFKDDHADLADGSRSFRKKRKILVQRGSGKRALQAATEIGQDALQGKNVRESVETHGGKVVKDFAEQSVFFCVKRGMDAREGEVNAVIYHLSRSKNWKPQDLPNA